MLTTGNYWEVVEYLREHELLELVILSNQFAKPELIIAKYIQNANELSENWHLDLLSQYPSYLRNEQLQINNKHLWFELSRYLGKISFQ